MGVSSPALFAVNRVVDCVFLLDLALQFFIPYRQSPQKGSRWVYGARSIATNYIKGAFILDLIATLPYDLCLLDAQLDGRVGGVVRAVRLLKMLKLVRIGKPLGRLVARLTIDLSVLELLKFLTITLFMAHWLACLWGFVGNITSNEPINLDIWYVESWRNMSWVQKHQLVDATPFELYGVGLYVAFANILGGPTEISPASCISLSRLQPATHPTVSRASRVYLTLFTAPAVRSHPPPPPLEPYVVL